MIQLWCLHGNLQNATVWSATLLELWSHPEVEIIPVDVWATLSLAHDCWDWAQQFCDQVKATGKTQNVVLGYSLGGRLALHALLHQPKLWQGAIATSTHPGYADQAVRNLCLQRDQWWGQRFLSEPWIDLLAEWDQLPVFDNIPCPLHRAEQDFSRELLARGFDIFSKGRQDNLRPQLKTLDSPAVLYLSGQLDSKYSQIARQLAQEQPTAQWAEIPQAGHRVPWENPEGFTEVVSDFVRSLLV